MTDHEDGASSRSKFDPNDLPPFVTIDEVAAVARCSVSSLHRKRKADPAWLPVAPMRMGRKLVFRREDVLAALQIGQSAASSEPEGSGWEIVDPEAIRRARQRAGDDARLERAIARARAKAAKEPRRRAE